MDLIEALDAELELITSSLLTAETLTASEPGTWPRTFDITSDDSKLSLHAILLETYPAPGSVSIDVKGKEMGRDEAEEWREWVREKMGEWDADEESPLFQLLTADFLPLLAASSPTSPSSPLAITTAPEPVPHHVLLTSHHLLSPTKSKLLLSLSSQLSLIGFSKTGHPGIMYAIGDHDDLVEWLREVKSWNWLALRVRIGVEPLPDGQAEEGSKGKEVGARGGKGRGGWVEVGKINEALEWLRKRGREELLLDLGMGAGSAR